MRRLSVVFAGVAVVVLSACASAPPAAIQPTPGNAGPPNLALIDSDIFWRTGHYSMGDGASSGGGDAGETGFYVRFRVTNNGAAPSTGCVWEVSVWRDDQWRSVTKGRIRALAVGDWVEVTRRLLPVQPGQTVRVWIDPTDEVPETTETDNVSSMGVPGAR